MAKDRPPLLKDAQIVKMWNDDYEMAIIITAKEELAPPEPEIPETPTGILLTEVVSLPMIPTQINANILWQQ